MLFDMATTLVVLLYASVAAPPVRTFLERFQFASERVKVEFVDLFEDVEFA